MSLAAPIQVRLERVMLREIRAAAAAKGWSISDIVRDRLSQFDRVDRQLQGLRGDLALHGAHAGAGPDDAMLDAVHRLMGMNAEVLAFMRRAHPLNAEWARSEVERVGLPIWARRVSER